MFKRLFTTSDFVKNSLSVVTASAITQFLPIITAPILTRIYTPNDYGLFGILISIIGLFNVFSTLGYANAIIIVKSDEDAETLVWLSLKYLLVCVTLSLIVILVFREIIVSTFNLSNTENLLFFVPISVFLNGIVTVFSLMAIRFKHFKIIATNKILSAVVSALISIFIGFLYKSYIGLILGFVFSTLVSSLSLLFFFRKKFRILSILSIFKKDFKVIASEYSNFPKYVLPSDFINNFSNLIPIFVLGTYAKLPQVAVGFYNMSNRILGLPIGLISSSIGDVFKQRAASDYNNLGTCRPIFMKTFKALFLTSVLPFSILIIFGADIFAFAFGETWRGAGEYSEILGFLFFFRFIVSPLTYVFYIANQQRTDLLLHFLFIFLGFLSLYFGIKIYEDVNLSLWFFTISYSLIYVVYFFFSYRLTINHDWKTN